MVERNIFFLVNCKRCVKCTFKKKMEKCLESLIERGKKVNFILETTDFNLYYKSARKDLTPNDQISQIVLT